jgi:hypothetical protein
MTKFHILIIAFALLLSEKQKLESGDVVKHCFSDVCIEIDVFYKDVEANDECQIKITQSNKKIEVLTFKKKQIYETTFKSVRN